jgi:hypothetical protein
MTPELRRATGLQYRVNLATWKADHFTRALTAEDVLDAPPEVRERMVEMADACEAFVRAWEGRER